MPIIAYVRRMYWVLVLPVLTGSSILRTFPEGIKSIKEYAAAAYAAKPRDNYISLFDTLTHTHIVLYRVILL